MNLLAVRHLKTGFRTARGLYQAVNDVSFTLEHGQALGLVGESGCGKTTCALSICRLLPPEGVINGGEVLLEGVDLTRLDDEAIRRRRWSDVSIIFQGAMNALNPVMRIGDQIAEAIVLHEGIARAAALRKAADLFEMVEIPASRIGQYAHEFSGGMKQRAMIAMALACRPKIVIGDEPTTALDVMVQAQILNLLDRLRKELNMGLILITHDLSLLGETCDRIAVMYAGKIVEMGAVERIFDEPAHPYTARLIGCFPVVGRERILPDGIDGYPPNLFTPPPGCPFHPRCGQATELCRAEPPTMRALTGDHQAACHFAGEVRHE